MVSDLVREHGGDTLAFFNLRADKHYLFSEDRRAFVGYAIENGVLLLSGDPVGPEEALPGLLHHVREFADSRGLKLGALGASQGLCPLYEELGLRTIYLGDEAVVDLGGFSLEGRPIRKVRQSVTRLRKAGYVAELRELRALDQDTLEQVEEVVELGRQGAPERGFSMAMDSLQGEHDHETLVRARARRRRRDPRRAAFRPLLRPPGGVAVVHAARSVDAQRADRVPRGAGDRAPERPRGARSSR